jgi:aspartyl protease family protein
MTHNNQEQHEQKRLGIWMVVIMWIIVLGLLTVFFQNWYEKQFNPNQSVNATYSEEGDREVVLKRNRFGHYVTTGMINDVVVVFMIDTGASDISIPASVAERIGLQRGRKVMYQTANGAAISYATNLDSVSIGNIHVRQVKASINPNVDGEEILLGMTFLKQLEFSQRGNELTLRQM